MTIKKIGILVPTRDNRLSLRDLIQSWRDTTDGYSFLLLGIDDDQALLYQDLMNETIKEDGIWPIFVGERMKLCPKLNYIADIVDTSIVGFVGDDVVFRTKEWEKEIVSWMEENHGICYCNDLLQGENLPNNVFIDKSIIDSMGYMVPPTLKHYYCDNFWKDLGIRLGSIKYFPDIIMEHKHWSNGKAEKDELYKESEKLLGEDCAAYQEYVNSTMTNDVEKIKARR